MSQSHFGKKCMVSLLIAIPWLLLAMFAIHWWMRLPATHPQFAIEHGSMDMALSAYLEPREYEDDWERRIRQSRPRDALALRDLLSNDRDVIRWMAASALGTMKDPGAVEDLIQVMQTDESAQVRYTVARALAEIGDERAVEPLIDTIADPDTTVRNIAVDSLGEMNAPQAIPQIEAFRKKHKYPSAQYSAEKALRLLRGEPHDAAELIHPSSVLR